MRVSCNTHDEQIHKFNPNPSIKTKLTKLLNEHCPKKSNRTHPSSAKTVQKHIAKKPHNIQNKIIQTKKLDDKLEIVRIGKQ